MATSSSSHTHGITGSSYDISSLTALLATPSASLISPSFGSPFSTGLSFSGPPTITTFDIGSTTNIQVNGCSAPTSKKFEEATDIFMSSLQLDKNAHNHFHYLIWQNLFGETFDDYGAVLKPGIGMFIAFGSKASRDQFENWFEDYQRTLFSKHKISETYLPDPVSGELNGMHVSDFERPPYEGYEFATICKSDFRDWTWIAENCYHPVYRLPKGWLFTNTTEAIHFKMRPSAEIKD